MHLVFFSFTEGKINKEDLDLTNLDFKDKTDIIVPGNSKHELFFWSYWLY